MKYTIIFLSILDSFLLSHCIMHKPNNNEALCTKDIKKDISINWKKLNDYTFWNPDLTFVRNDNFIDRVKNRYSLCLNNCPKDTIISLFGESTYYKTDFEVGYACAPVGSKNAKDMVCLRFLFDKNRKLTNIISPECWAKID